MRFTLRKTLVLAVCLAVAVPFVSADHFVADCPLSLVGSSSAASSITSSPHAVFKNGTVIYALRGDRLTTLNITELGDVQVARDDLVTPLAGRDLQGAATYNNGYLYVSSEAGIEAFDLRNTKGGADGTAPTRVSITATPHYRRLTAMGNVLAALFPATDLPCIPRGGLTCTNSIDLYSIADPSKPVLAGRISAFDFFFVAFNDIKFANGYLYTTGIGGTFAFDVTNTAAPTLVYTLPVPGTWLATNGANLLAIGQEKLIGVEFIGPGPVLNYFAVFTLPTILNRGNDLMFHPEATFDSTHLITMIDEKDPQTGKSARTVAFDVFDFTVPFYEGFDDRIYENVSYTVPDEVKFNPTAVGPFIYVVGQTSGLQVWGSCGQIAGAIEFESTQALPCGGAEIRGYVLGANRIAEVELFLDGTSLGMATIGSRRTDVSDTAPVVGWRVPVNLDEIAAGTHTLRAVATDVAGNTRQFASKVVTFSGPGHNCTARRRSLRQ